MRNRLAHLLASVGFGVLATACGGGGAGKIMADTPALPYQAPDIDEITGIDPDEEPAEQPEPAPAPAPAPAPTPAAATPPAPAPKATPAPKAPAPKATPKAAPKAAPAPAKQG